jgi:tripartite-type tricarboxylate transporter receptor subunit TctC
MLTNRRKTLTLALATMLPWTLKSQERFPSRPVTLVVPQAAGGANDAIARILAQRLTEQTGQQFVAENRAGAGGNVGTAAVAKAKNDGYTLMLTTNSVQVINPWLYKNTGFDPVKDFDPVAMVATAGYVLVANNSFPAKNVAELVALAKAQPGKITIASAGNGTLNHLIGEMLQRATGIEMTHVPYRGAAAAVTDLVAGQVQVSVQSLPSSISFIRSGRLKVLGTVNETRVAALPEIATIGETIRGFGSTPWYAVFAPAGAPKPAIAWLHTEIAKALDAPEVKEKLGGVGCEPFKGTPEQLAATVRDDLPRWQRLVKESGATLD